MRRLAAQLIAGGVGALIFGTACSAIVSGKLGETDDYKKGSITGSSSGTLGACSLLLVETQKNACSDCIETRCKEDVDYACQEGKQEKAWFQDLQDCAQSPYLSFESGNSYDCRVYQDAGPAIGKEDDAARKRASEICVNQKCMAGATPPCKLCPVNTTKPGVQEKAKLAESDCGQCLEEKCAAEIVQCCATSVLQKHVAKCAYTAEESYKADCNDLAQNDAGPDFKYENEEGKACQTIIRDCFQTNCKARCAASN